MSPENKGCDFSFARPDLGQLKAMGITWCGRYLTGSGKALTTAEAQQILAAGLGLVLIFEAGAGNALGGDRQGHIDGRAAKAAADALGAPAGVAIFFTVDEDTRDLADVEAYGRAFAAEISPHPCGAYAEGLILEDLVHLGVAVHTWQTSATAWAGGKDSQADIIQGGSALGGAIDLDDTTTTDFGAWWPQSAAQASTTTRQEAPMGKGYVELAADGGVFAFGDIAASVNAALDKTGRVPGTLGPGITAVAFRFTTSGQGFWIVTSDGGIRSYGDAEFDGSMGGQHLNAPVVAFAPAPGA